MTINSNRTFQYNGFKYYIQTVGKKQYAITRIINDRPVLMYNKIGWDMPTFSTIKDAKRYVRDWDFILEAL